MSFLSVKVAALKPLYECSAADSDTCAVYIAERGIGFLQNQRDEEE